MKKILLLTLAATLTAFGSVAMADDSTVTIGVSKSDDNTAKVVTWPGDKNPTMVPITFADGTSWNDVKDSYDVSPDVVSGLDAKKMSICVASDGGISFKSMAPKTMASKDSSKKTK